MCNEFNSGLFPSHIWNPFSASHLAENRWELRWVRTNRTKAESMRMMLEFMGQKESFFFQNWSEKMVVFFRAQISLQKAEVEVPNQFGYCKSPGSIMRRRDGGRRADEALRVRTVSGLRRAPRRQPISRLESAQPLPELFLSLSAVWYCA